MSDELEQKIQRLIWTFELEGIELSVEEARQAIEATVGLKVEFEDEARTVAT
jgi:hypothetical protein